MIEGKVGTHFISFHRLFVSCSLYYSQICIIVVFFFVIFLLFFVFSVSFIAGFFLFFSLVFFLFFVFVNACFCSNIISSRNCKIINANRISQWIIRNTINDFKAYILKKGKCKLSINSKNLDEDITPQELHSFTSVTSQDGNWFFHWFIV